MTRDSQNTSHGDENGLPKNAALTSKAKIEKGRL